MRSLVQTAIASLLLASAFALSSCITTLTEPLNLSFKETLVIRGALRAGEPVRDIAITKSLDALSVLSDSAVAVYDAAGELEVDGRSFPLRLQSGGANGVASLYCVLGEGGAPLIAESGKTYKLTARWKNATAYAQTAVPEAPNVQRALLLEREILSLTSATIIPGTLPVTTTRRDTLLGVELAIIPRPETAYRAGVFVSDARGNALTDAYEGGLVLSSSATSAVEARLVSGLLPLQTQALLQSEPGARIVASAIAFDKAYYVFSQTLSRGRQASNLFGGTNGENVLWNVQGDGIGIFVGVAETRRIVR